MMIRWLFLVSLTIDINLNAAVVNYVYYIAAPDVYKWKCPFNDCAEKIYSSIICPLLLCSGS